MLRLCLLPAVLLFAAAAGAADRYTIDVDHTFPSLEMTHMGISVWRGKFNRTTGTFTYDRAARSGTVDVEVPVSSIDWGHDAMNEHSLKPDWLDAERFPVMKFVGRLRFEGDVPVAVEGPLTLRGVTKPLKLKLNSFKCMVHPYYKKDVCGADAEGELNRADFGMTQYTENGAGIIKLRIQVEALKAE